MQSHIWDCTVATIVKQKLFFIHLRLFLFYLSPSSLHFFLLSFSLCFANECALPMVVGCGWWFDVLRRFCGTGFVGLSSWVWVCGFEFMGMGLWVWVHGSAFCGASTSRLATTIAGSSCIRKETRKLCQGTSQSTSKSWTKEALLRQNGIASLAIASQLRMFTTIRRLFTVIPGTDSGWWVLSGVEIGVVGFCNTPTQPYN